MLLQRLLTGAVLLVLVGCANVATQPLKVSADHPIKSIGLIAIPNPVNYHAMDFANPGLAFGAVGGAIAGGQVASQTDQFDKMLKETGFDFAKTFSQELEATLVAAGYTVVPALAERAKPDALLKDYGTVNARDSVDAYLDVVPHAMGVGYSTVNLFDNDFRPDVRVALRLVSAKTGEILYSESFIYGYKNPLMSATKLEAPKVHYVDKFAQLMESSDYAIEGLEVGIKSISDKVGSRLNKEGTSHAMK